jgi:hypothetical protein
MSRLVHLLIINCFIQLIGMFYLYQCRKMPGVTLDLKKKLSFVFRAITSGLIIQLFVIFSHIYLVYFINKTVTG